MKGAVSLFTLSGSLALDALGYRPAAVVVALGLVVWTSFEIGRYFPRRAA